jgi:ribose transport system substrate-binding protein
VTTIHLSTNPDEGTTYVTLSLRSRAASSVITGAVAAVALVCVAGCSSSKGTATAADSGLANATSTVTTDEGLAHAKDQLAKYAVARDSFGTVVPVANVPDLHGKTVWYIPIGASVPVLSTIGVAMTDALKNLGADVHVCDGKFLPTTIGGCMTTAVNQGASAIVTGFVDYSLIPTAFQNVVAHHIPVLVGGEPPSSGQTSNSKLAFFDVSGLTRTAFKLMSDAAIVDSNGSGEVLALRLTDSSATSANSDVGIAELKQYCAKCRMHTVDLQTAKVDKLGSAISAALVSHPGTRYVIIPQDAYLPAALPGIQSAGFTSKVEIITAGGSTAGLQQVKSGAIAYNVGQGAIYNGWGFADATVRLLAGAEVQAETDGPVRVFTKSNVANLTLSEAAYASPAWYGSDQFAKDFLTAWGVK